MMALLRSHQMEYAHRSGNKEFQWQEGTDDIFDSFINPDSFHLASGSNTSNVDQRRISNDFVSFFGTHASSSGSDSLDIATIPAVDEHVNSAWTEQFSSLSFERQEDEALRERFNQHLSIYSNRKASCSETDIIVLPIDDVEDDCAHAVTAPSTPRWRKARRPSETQLTVRKRQSSTSPSKTTKIEKNQRRVTTIHRSSPHKASHRGVQLAKRLKDVDATGQLAIKVRASTYRLATPPASTDMRSTSFDWDFTTERKAVRSPGLFVDDEFDDPVSSTTSSHSNDYSQLQHHNTPADEGAPLSPVHGNRLRSPDRISRANVSTEPHAQNSYNSPAFDPTFESFASTPPSTEPMMHAPWSPGDAPSSFMQQNGFGPPSPHVRKADYHQPVRQPDMLFTGPGGVAPMTCWAPAMNVHGLPDEGFFGLGISGISDGQPQEHGLDNTPSKRGDVMHSQMQQNGVNSHNRSSSGNCGNSALLLNQDQQNIYPMSPLLDSGTQSYALSTGSQTPYQGGLSHFSPTPAQMQTRQTYHRPMHRRSRTVGAAPVDTIPPSMLTLPASRTAFSSLSFPPLPPSPSPPMPSSATPRTSPRRNAVITIANQASPTPRQRSKSAHHARRKSTGTSSSSSHDRTSLAAKAGFVNLTPQDSRKILTGVAPSGSSKTKARREKEAADKRRKLGEAAKRVVLEAGGDLGALEREVLALSGEA